MDIRNDAECKKALLDILDKVIEEVSKKILKILQKHIKEDVYEFDGSNKVYFNGSGKPTFQFYQAWDWKAMKKTVNQITKELVYDPRNMDFDPDKWLHGSFAGDARKTLMDILNKPFKGDGMRTSSLKFGNTFLSKRRRPYWDLTIEELNETIDRLILSELQKFGNIRKG
jgi:hypothetical protein